MERAPIALGRRWGLFDSRFRVPLHPVRRICSFLSQYNGLVEFNGLVLALSVQFPLSVVLLSAQGFRIAQVRKPADPFRAFRPLRASAFNSAYVAMSSPPSTRMMLPLIQVRAGSLRATRVWATSSGVVMRLAG
jgi:hypothetical protein